MKALILDRGFVTELGPLTVNIPETLVDFANKPIILHQIEALESIGLDEVVVAINYKSEVMSNFFKDFKGKLGIKTTILQAAEPLGTAGPLVLARDELIDGSGEPFFVLNSDVVGEYPLKEMVQFHKSHGGEASIHMIKVDEPSKYGMVVMDNATGTVEKFVETLKMAGIYLLNPSVLDRIELKSTSIENEVFPKIAAEEKLFAMLLPEPRVCIIRQPWDYITGLGLYLSLLKKNSPSKLATGPHIMGNVIVDETAEIGEECDIGRNVVIGPNCTVGSGVRLHDCIIMQGVRIGEDASIGDSIIGRQSFIGARARVMDSILGENARVHDGIYCNGGVVYPDKEVESAIRKPKIVM